MYEHIVLFKFNENGTVEKQEQAIHTVLSLKGSFPGLLNSAQVSMLQKRPQT
jgi:hypothetical protein